MIISYFHFNEKYERTFGRIRYLIMLKRNISDVYFHKLRKSKTKPLEKTLNMQSVVILINSGFNKNHDHYHYYCFF